MYENMYIYTIIFTSELFSHIFQQVCRKIGYFVANAANTCIYSLIINVASVYISNGGFEKELIRELSDVCDYSRIYKYVCIIILYENILL